MTCQDALATIAVMRTKEETDYRCEDYITNFAQSHENGTSPLVVDRVCRKLMADWCLKVVDRCSFTRDTATIAMSMLDRYLANDATALVNRNVFQLASMTCLYTAIKIHESEALQPETIVQLSRGIFSVKDIEAMEVSILFAISWRTNPPTPLTFVQYFLEALTGISQEQKTTLLELAKVQTEMTIADYSYVCQNASSIAFASLANAMKMLHIPSSVLDVLANLANIEEVATIQRDLSQRMQQQEGTEIMSAATTTTVRASPVKAMQQQQQQSGHSSPREVRAVNQ